MGKLSGKPASDSSLSKELHGCSDCIVAQSGHTGGQHWFRFVFSSKQRCKKLNDDGCEWTNSDFFFINFLALNQKNGFELHCQSKRQVGWQLDHHHNNNSPDKVTSFFGLAKICRENCPESFYWRSTKKIANSKTLKGLKINYFFKMEQAFWVFPLSSLYDGHSWMFFLEEDISLSIGSNPGSFQTNIITIFTTTGEKNVHQVYGAGIRPSVHESPPITTKPGLFLFKLVRRLLLIFLLERKHLTATWIEPRGLLWWK